MESATPRLRPESVMRRDGTVTVERLGIRNSWWRDLYHFMLKGNWGQVLMLLSGGYLVLNTVFAVLFWLPGDAIQGASDASLLDAFFFSVQTFSTIGYGGLAPAGLYANLLVTLEALIGLLYSAMATGLIFAKFAAPTSRVRFSQTAIIGRHDGQRTFMFRMANERANQIVEASMHVVVIRREVTQEGEQMRRFYDLPLRRSRTPVFSLGWTAYHTIDEDSPLANATMESLADQEAVILVSLSGTDSTMAQTVNARHAYAWTDIEFDRRFVDLMQIKPDGTRSIDYGDFHSTEPCEAAEMAVSSRAP